MADIITGNFVCIEQTPASVGERIAGRIIDMIAVTAYAYTVTVFLQNSSFDGWTHAVILLYILAIYLPVMAYTFLAEMLFNGQTLGKYIMRTRTVMADGSSPTMGALLLRYVCELIDIWFGCIGLVFITATRRHQRLGDMAAGTMVIRKEDMSRMHFTLNEFGYARRGFKPTYECAAKLSPRQADILRRTLYGKTNPTDIYIDRLAAKVCRTLGIPEDAAADNGRKFLHTIYYDYMYLKQSAE